MKATRLGVALAAAVLAVLALAAWSLGLRVNATPSMARGVYQLRELHAVRVGGLVCFDPSARSAPKAARAYLGDELPLLKRVVALEGALIERDPVGGGLTVDGIRLPCSNVFSYDTRGQALPAVGFPLVVPPGSVWLSSDHNQGFDSRYYGPVPIDSLRCGEARALWTWEGGERC